MLPSPILDRLSRHTDALSKQKSIARHSAALKLAGDKQDKAATSNTAVVNKITDAFSQLRSVAMKNVCV